MNLEQAVAYAKMLGCRVEQRLFDGGYSVHAEHPAGHHFTGTFYWGDEERHTPIMKAFVRHLNGLPWPTEDDPRAVTEGVTL